MKIVFVLFTVFLLLIFALIGCVAWRVLKKIREVGTRVAELDFNQFSKRK